MSEAHSSSTVTSHAASASSSSDDDPPPDLHALLRKKGRKTRLPVRRMFVLRAGTLYNFRNPKADAPSWKVALAGAVVGLDPRTLRIVVLLNPHRTLVLYADSPQQASQWTEALARAAAFERGPDTSTTSRGSSGSSTAWDADTANNNNIAEIRTMTSFVDDEDSDWRKGARHPDFGLPPQDLALDVPENDNWDSFRSFAKLHIRTATGPDAIRERVAMGLAQPRYGDAVAYA
ncbi:unnamed protein product [Chondrus crispus]|uniref:PH domain-containing protein n=1 Tax=Chondrus crispus TaxID=2769 RepID=R7QFI1_CHOCR|nr:unnamed protein product [Chondrus crispus]CDF36180.1 unnamed protein product [Chondrus crispus]|eukprot:XP_005715999.1 unnamed protein product [Chondrus crispus]